MRQGKIRLMGPKRNFIYVDRSSVAGWKKKGYKEHFLRVRFFHRKWKSNGGYVAVNAWSTAAAALAAIASLTMVLTR